MAQGRNTLMDPPIEDLLDKVDSKFTLVALGLGPGPAGELVLQQPGRGPRQGRAAPGGVGLGQARLHRLRGDRRRQGDLHPVDPEEEALLAAAAMAEDAVLRGPKPTGRSGEARRAADVVGAK
jgi:hypothetical protein